MFRIYSALIEVLAVAVFIIPAFLCFNRLIFHSGKRTALYLLFGFYFTAVLALVGFPSINSLEMDAAVNLIPFADMASDFVNACLNVLLFLPFGFCLPILWSRFRDIKRLLLAALITICVIEASQILNFRTTDVNDFITNTAGTVIGYFLANQITKKFSKHIISGAKSRDFYVICGAVEGIMFFLRPLVLLPLWDRV